MVNPAVAMHNVDIPLLGKVHNLVDRIFNGVFKVEELIVEIKFLSL